MAKMLVDVSDVRPVTPDADGRCVPAAGADAHGLSEREAAMLVFEREWWRYAASHGEAVQARFDLPPARYDTLLDALVDDPRALEVDPMLVKRLRRMRAARRRGGLASGRRAGVA